jgi:hypothetical protein
MSRKFLVAFLILTPLVWPNGARGDFVYNGSATGAYATVEVTFLIGSTGPLPSAGGVREVDVPSASFNSLLTAGPISGVTRGSNGLATADITVNNFLLMFGGNTISAQMIGGHATADGHTGGRPEVGGFSDFLGLIVNGQPVAVTGAPNQQIDLPNNERLVLNEQFTSSGDTVGTITLNALHLYGSPIVDFRIASAQAGITADPNAGPIPEPDTLPLLVVGLACLFGLWFRR